MKIHVTGADGRLSEVLRGTVVRRVLLALSRFGPRVRRVTVSLAKPANVLGGVDQRCRMRARLLGSDDVRAEAINGGVEVAVTRTAALLAKRVGFALNGDGSDGAGAPSLARRPTAPAPRRRTRTD